MKSIAHELVYGFGITPSFRPRITEQIVVGLLVALENKESLSQAIDRVSKFTGEDFSGDLHGISAVAKDENIAFLYKNPTAIAIYLKILPLLLVTKVNGSVNIKLNVDKRTILKAIDELNRLDLGFKAYTIREDEISFIVYTNRESLLENLRTLNLPMKIQDRVLQW
jgi:hypothetical protein